MKLKICVMLIISASLEVENGISNLWRRGEGPGFKDYPDYGQYIPMNYFEAFVCGFPHLWSPREYWYADNVPWESFLPLIKAFNGKRTDLIKSTYLVLDESMSAWRPKTTKTGGLPNITYEPRKPKPLGTMFKNGVEAVTGIVVYQDVVETSEAQAIKKYAGDLSSLPLGEPILKHVAEVMRQCEGAKLCDGGWVGGDAWFGSIPAVVELKNKMNIYSTFIVKQNIQYFPKQVLHKVLMARYPRYPAGHHVVMKVTIAGVDLFALAYAYSNQGVTTMVSSSGTTIRHEKDYRSNIVDDYGNVTFREIPRPCVAHFLFELLPLIDNHNKDRQSLLALEDCWPTKSPWFRLVTTLIGMSVVDLHRWDRNRRSGGKGLLDIGDDEGNPSFLSVRSIANLVSKGLRRDEMKYRIKARYSHPLRRSMSMDNPGSALLRITDKDGCEKRMSGQREREYQKTCFVCRKYQKQQVNTIWWCKFCHMPLCKISRGRGMSCEQEHVTTSTGVFSCKGPGVKRTFVLSKRYRQYQWANEDDDDDHEDEDDNDEDDDDGDDDNDGNDDGEDDEDHNDEESFHSSVSVEPRRKAAGNKSTESAYSTRSSTALRRSKRARA